MKVLIIDNDPYALRHIKLLLENEEDVKIVAVTTDNKKAFQLVNKYKPDIVFLDIKIPGMTGIELAGKLGKNVHIVFITAHENYALEAFRIGAMDYLVKPIDSERISITVERARKIINSKNNNKLIFNSKGSIVNLNVNNIIFIEKLPLTRKILITSLDKEYLASGTLEMYEKKLSKHGFARAHKSYIVNLSMILEMIPFGDKSYMAKLYGTKRDIIISRHYAPHIKSILKNF